MRDEPANPPGRPDQRRVGGIDLLRGIAILTVLLNHVNMRLYLKGIPYWQGMPRQLRSSLVWNGQRGVQMFFAISGFLITSTALRRWGSLDKIRAGHFYRIRFARIAPLLLLLLALLSVLHLAHVFPFRIAAKVATLPQALAAALTFRINVLEANHGYLPGNWDVLWSLSVEEVFYLAFPLACLIFRRRGLFCLALLPLVIMGPFARTVWAHGNDTWSEYSYLGGMDAIAMGCIAALAVPHIRAGYLRWMGWAGALLLAVALGCTRWPPMQALENSGLDMTVVGFATCLICAAAARLRPRMPVALAPLLRMGERSYEIYLTHMFVVLGCFTLFLKTERQPWVVFLLFAACILVSACLGSAVAQWFSEPANRILRPRGQSGPVTVEYFSEETRHGR